MTLEMIVFCFVVFYFFLNQSDSSPLFLFLFIHFLASIDAEATKTNVSFVLKCHICRSLVSSHVPLFLKPDCCRYSTLSMNIFFLISLAKLDTWLKKKNTQIGRLRFSYN